MGIRTQVSKKLWIIVTLSSDEDKNSYKVNSWLVVLAYFKNEAFNSGNTFEIMINDEIQIMAYLNRVIISVNEYDN